MSVPFFLEVPVGPKFGVDDLLFSAGNWTWATADVFLAGLIANGGGHDFRVDSSGQVTPTAGGAGTFNAQVQSFPEPSAIALFTFGVIGMGLIGRKSSLQSCGSPCI
jgi:hypothetical protein